MKNIVRSMSLLVLLVLVLTACSFRISVPGSDPVTIELLKDAPTALPTQMPTAAPTAQPTLAPTAAPTQAPPTAQPTAASTSGPTAAPTQASLNFDETNGDALTVGQTQLVAQYLRLPGPISQAQLEKAVSSIQVEAANSKAEVYEGTSLTLNQNQAWFVWCPDATNVDPPADVSFPVEVTLLDKATLGRVYVQVPFAAGVPLRTDDTWTGCTNFWAVAVH